MYKTTEILNFFVSAHWNLSGINRNYISDYFHKHLKTDKLDVIIFGATGFAGRQTIQEAVNILKDLHWGIAGRNRVISLIFLSAIYEFNLNIKQQNIGKVGRNSRNNWYENPH